MWFHSPCEHDLRSGVPEGQSSRPAWPAHPRSQMAVRMWMRVRRRRTGSSSNWRRCAMRSIVVVIRGRCRCVASRAIREHGIGKRESVPASHRDRFLPIRRRSRRRRDAVSTTFGGCPVRRRTSCIESAFSLVPRATVPDASFRPAGPGGGARPGALAAEGERMVQCRFEKRGYRPRPRPQAVETDPSNLGRTPSRAAATDRFRPA